MNQLIGYKYTPLKGGLNPSQPLEKKNKKMELVKEKYPGA
jgi:hypothetical protein